MLELTETLGMLKWDGCSLNVRQLRMFWGHKVDFDRQKNAITQNIPVSENPKSVKKLYYIESIYLIYTFLW
jgi:hypothetical protein